MYCTLMRPVVSSIVYSVLVEASSNSTIHPTNLTWPRLTRHQKTHTVRSRFVAAGNRGRRQRRKTTFCFSFEGNGWGGMKTLPVCAHTLLKPFSARKSKQQKSSISRENPNRQYSRFSNTCLIARGTATQHSSAYAPARFCCHHTRCVGVKKIAKTFFTPFVQPRG